MTIDPDATTRLSTLSSNLSTLSSGTQVESPRITPIGSSSNTLQSAEETESSCLDYLFSSCIARGLCYIGGLLKSLWDCLFGSGESKTKMVPKEPGETDEDWILRSEFAAGLVLPSPSLLEADIRTIINRKISYFCSDNVKSEALFPCRIVVKANLKVLDATTGKKESITLKLGSFYQKEERDYLKEDLEGFRDQLLGMAKNYLRMYTIEFFRIEQEKEEFHFTYGRFGNQSDSSSFVIFPEVPLKATLADLRMLYTDPQYIQATDLVDDSGNLSTTEL